MALRPKGLVPSKGPRVPVEVYPAIKPSELDALDPNRVGIVFIHGIGTQPACETFLGWSAPVVELLSDWRHEHGFGADPVLRCDYDFSGSRLPILELGVPEYDGHPAQTWVVTEAWWASVTRSPGLSAMTRYVRRAMPRIMAGIREGYAVRLSIARRNRLVAMRTIANRSAATPPAPAPDRAPVAAAAVASTDPSRSTGGPAADLPFAGLSTTVGGQTATPSMPPRDTFADDDLVAEAVDRRWAWIDVFDRAQKKLTVLAFGPALVLGTLALLVYAPFRAIPIAAIQNLAVLKSADNFLVHWFGELPDILDDPVQASNVRFRLVNAIRGLRREGCGRIVVVAHSGGAIVSFTTLLDETYRDEPVDKLITLGQGLALGWRIADAWKNPLPLGSRLAGNLVAARPNLRWADFWSSYDPAPAGPLRPPSVVTLRDLTNPTVNRMSLLEDHGAYWENDEEFLMPLLRHLDTPHAASTASRFYRDIDRRQARIERRRERVAVLALWRWIASFGAVSPLLVGTLAAIFGLGPGPGRLGEAIANGWGRIPGHEIISGLVDGLAGAASGPGSLRLAGQWVLGSLAVVLLFLILSRIGVGRWQVWDQDERRAARLRVLRPVSRVRPMLVFLGLTVLCAALAVVLTLYFLR